MSSHGDQILFEILEELRELKKFFLKEIEPEKCADCGCDLNEGEAKTFTVCDECWDKHYSKGEVE